jgi:hypothetical protein
MARTELARFATIRLVSGKLITDANLEYSKSDSGFVVKVPGGFSHRTSRDLKFQLTEPMIRRIIYRPDGGIELPL